MSLKDRIKRHEGLSLKPYVDSEGYCSIGYGRKIRPITAEQAEDFLSEDLESAWAGARNLVPTGTWIGLDEIRREVLAEMVFQLGERGVGKFWKMLACLKVADYDKAADEMLDSLWHKQTPARCRELAEMMRIGKEPIK